MGTPVRDLGPAWASLRACRGPQEVRGENIGQRMDEEDKDIVFPFCGPVGQGQVGWMAG